ncbi:MAG: metallophosphoesterase [Bacteroidota bacterium]
MNDSQQTKRKSMPINALFFLWIGIMVTVLSLGYYYMGQRIIIPFKLEAPYKQIAWSVLTLMYLIPFSSFFLLRVAEKWSDFFSWIGYVGLGFLSFVFVMLFFRDIAWLAGLAGQKLFSLLSSSPQTVDAAKREFLLQTTNLGVLGVAGTLTAYGVYEARKTPGIVNVDIPIAKFPQEFDGFRIVQISDIHAGLTIKRDFIEVIADEVRKLAPDLIAFTGDMADGSVPHLKNDLAPLADVYAPHGKFFVTGNHEYYSGADQWVTHAREMGYDVLMNEHRLVTKNGASFVLAGVTDYSGGGFSPAHKSDPAKALNGAPKDLAKILLAHQPRTLFHVNDLDLDLVLMGHTHGGQFFPWNLVATIGQPFIKGLNKYNDRTWAYVSKGTGYWGPPVRVGARSEITVLTLKKA